MEEQEIDLIEIDRGLLTVSNKNLRMTLKTIHFLKKEQF